MLASGEDGYVLEEDPLAWVVRIPEGPTVSPGKEQFTHPYRFISEYKDVLDRHGAVRVRPPPSYTVGTIAAAMCIGQSVLGSAADVKFDVTTRSMGRQVQTTTGKGNLRDFSCDAQRICLHHCGTNTEPPREEFERIFWRNMTIPQRSPVEYKFSSLIPMSGFSKVPGLKNSARDWNLSAVAQDKKSFLHKVGPLPETLETHLTLHSAFSHVPWKVHGLGFIHFMHSGPGTTWYSVPPSGLAAFREVLKRYKERAIPLDELIKDGIPVFKIHQRGGEFVVVSPSSYHFMISHGTMTLESVAVGHKEWLPEAYKFYMDLCIKDQLTCSNERLPWEYIMSKATDKLHRLSPQCVASVKHIKAMLLARIGLLLKKAEKHGLSFQKFPLTTAKGFRGLKCCKCRNSCFLAGVVPESESKLANVVCLRCTFPKKKGYKRHGRGAVLVSADLRPDEGLAREACVHSGPCEVGFNFVAKLVESLYGPEPDSDNCKKRRREEQDGSHSRKITRVVFRVPQLPQNVHCDAGGEIPTGLDLVLASRTVTGADCSDPSNDPMPAGAKLPMAPQTGDSPKYGHPHSSPVLPTDDVHWQEPSDVDTAMHAVDEAVEASIAGVLDAVCDLCDTAPNEVADIEDSAMPGMDCLPFMERVKTDGTGLFDSFGQSPAAEVPLLEDTGHGLCDGTALRQEGELHAKDIGATASGVSAAVSPKLKSASPENLGSNSGVLQQAEAVVGEAVPFSGHNCGFATFWQATTSLCTAEMSQEVRSISEDACADDVDFIETVGKVTEDGFPSPGQFNVPSRTCVDEDVNAGVEGTPCQGPRRHVPHIDDGTPSTMEGTIVSPPCCESAKGGVRRPPNGLSTPTASRTPCRLLQVPFQAAEEALMAGLDGQPGVRRTVLTHEDSPGEKYLLLDQLLASLYPSKTHEQEQELWQRAADVAGRFGVKIAPPGWGWYNDRMEYILAWSDVMVLHAALEGLQNKEQAKLRRFVDGVWFDDSDWMDNGHLMEWVERVGLLTHDTI